MAMALAAVAFAAPSCDKYEDGRPAKEVRNEFDRMYPDAKDVEWEAESGYWKVSFETGSAPDIVEHEAWYDASGSWVRTETEIPLSAVPQEIKDFLAASDYGTAIIDGTEIEYVETPAGNSYRFEVTVAGMKINVEVSEDGNVSVGGLGGL